MSVKRTIVRNAVTLAVLGTAWAPPFCRADDKSSPAKPAAPAAASPGKAAAGEPKSGTEFSKLFDEWRELLAKLRYLQEQYQVAAPSARPALAKQFNELLDKGRTLAGELSAAAEKDYQKDPTNDTVADFVLQIAIDAIRTDNYEEAYRLSNLLLEHGCKNSAIYNIAGLSSYCVNDFDSARKYFKLASDNKDISEAGKRSQLTLDSIAEDWKRESELRSAEAKQDDLPRVRLSTTKGDIVVELFENEAPNTTANFISLVEKKFYDGTPFHRVLSEFMAQGGDPEGSGKGGPGYSIACECYQPNYRRHFRGSLSMAHAGRDTGGSQFFLTFVPTVSLNGKHTVFGRVVEGMDVLTKLQRINPERPKGEEPDRIIKATVERKRDHEYTPVTKG